MATSRPAQADQKQKLIEVAGHLGYLLGSRGKTKDADRRHRRLKQLVEELLSYKKS